MRRHSFLAGLTVLLAAWGCQPRPAGPAAQAPTDPGPVAVVQPVKKKLVKVVEQPGTVQPFEETQLFARVPGYVVKLNADIGQKVKAGDVLAEIDVPELAEEAKQKQAMVRRAEAETIQARKALASAEAHVAAAEAAANEAKASVGRAQANHDRWESEAKRIGTLVQQGVVDAQTGDETRNQFRSAQAARDEAKARVASTEALVRKAKTDQDKAAADVEAAVAHVEVAKADARRVEAMLAFGKMRAPYDGVVTRRRVNTGDLLPLGLGKSEGLFTLARLDPVRLVVNVPEADAPLVLDGGEVHLTVTALKGPPLKGQVARTSWALEPGARTLRTEIDMPNPDNRLRPGMYVHARLTEILPEEWVLPATAIVKQGDTLVGFRIVDGKAVRTPVHVGHGDGTWTEVSRLQKPGTPPAWVPLTGEETFAARAAGLTDGQVVEVESR